MVKSTFLSCLVLLGPGAQAAPWFRFLAARDPVAADCTREALKAATETYLAAQAAGKPETLLALASASLVYTEDGRARDPKTGVLSTALRLDHNRSSLDATQCATYTELVSTDATRPRVVGTQMRFDRGSSGLKLAKVESLVTQPGDWGFNASRMLGYAAGEDGRWGAIPEPLRDGRAVIQAAADAYLDLFNNKSVVVPWGTPCDRLEGSFYTGPGLANDTCNIGVPNGIVIKDRRYVIDETVGAVDCLVTFSTRPDSHEFRIEKGKIRFVHTLTIMRNLTM